MILRGLIIAASGYATRRETYDGREHLVLPVVGLVEGVVHAMNARQPEFVSAAEFSRAPHAWNGRPLFYGHPTLHGRPISGNAPDVLERSCVGKVFGAGVKNKKLQLEAWLDVEAAKLKAPELLARAEASEPFEVSVGVFVSTDKTSGEHMGKKWLGAWADLNPDHLAILPPGQPGACSREMGCGVRAAADGEDLNAWSEETGVLRSAYSPDQERDEKGRFAGGAAAHEGAAELHYDAAHAHEMAYGGTGQEKLDARRASARAEKGTKEANAKSAKLGIATHGQRAANAASKANEHAREDHHDAAAKAHGRAANNHEKLAELIRKAGELHDKLRTAEETDIMDPTTWEDERERFEALRAISADARKKIPADDFAEPPDGFPVVEPIDVHDAALAIGRAKDNPSTVKGRIVSIAYRKGAEFVAQLPDAWKKTSDQKNASGFARFMERARELFGILPDDVTPEAESELRAAWPDKSGNDDHGRAAHEAAAKAHEKAASYHEGKATAAKNGQDYHAEISNARGGVTASAKALDATAQTTGSHTAMAMAKTALDHAYSNAMLPGGGHVHAAQAHENAAAAHRQAAMAHRSSYRNAEVGDLEKPTAAGAPCGCKHGNAPTTAEENEMTREQIMEAMKTASPEQLKALSAALGEKPEPKQPTESELKAAADAKAAQDKADADKRTAEIKAAVDAGIAALTFDQVMAKATPDVRAAVDAGQKAAKARKDASIKALVDLKRGGFTAESLGSKSQDELDGLVALAQADVPATDYSIGGAPRMNLGADEKKEVAGPPDLTAAIRAAAKKK